jgi:tRNA (guanine37-N1)-methyltransferase
MKASSLKRLDIVSLFPAMFDGPLSMSLLGRARERGLVDLRLHNLRDFSADAKHHKVDDRPYGGGAGMVLQAEPLYRALKSVKASGKGAKLGKPFVVYLSPQGSVLDQAAAEKLAQQPWLVFLCGHYEGFDERIMDWVDAEVSIGNYVLTGGEIPAMVLADCVIRLVPGVVKEADSILHDSFQKGLLDYPHYTRPARWRSRPVPSVLLSGDHKAIQKWRLQAAEAATRHKRPELLRVARSFKGSRRAHSH